MGVYLKAVLLILFSSLAFHSMTETSFAGTSPESLKRPFLNGTFIQLLDQNGNWNKLRWERMFDSFKELGLSQVVIQWTLHDNRAFYPTRTFDQAPQPPLETILEQAAASGIQVYLGLAADSRYWEMIRQPPGQQEEYLRRLRRKSEQVAQEVSVIANKHNSFKGWYITEEIDDLNWRSPKARELLLGHIRQLSDFLKKLTPGAMVLQSAFSNARMNPDSYQQFWERYFKESSVDMLLFQDGAGTGKLPGDLLPLYLQGVRNAADANGRKLQVIVELFFISSESPFKAAPAPLLRIINQLKTADSYSSGGINSFSVPDYMSHEGGDEAIELLNGYRKYKGSGQMTTP